METRALGGFLTQSRKVKASVHFRRINGVEREVNAFGTGGVEVQTLETCQKRTRGVEALPVFHAELPWIRIRHE